MQDSQKTPAQQLSSTCNKPLPPEGRPAHTLGGLPLESGGKASQEHAVTIRVKLVILMASFIAAIVLVVSFMACHAYEDSYQIAVSGSKTTVQSVTSYVSLFFRSDEENSAFAAILPQTVAAGAASFPCPPERAQNAHPSENEPPGNGTGQTLERLAQSSPSYLAVGLAT